MKKPRIAFMLQMFGIGGMPKWLYQIANRLQDEFEFFFIATHSSYVRPEYQKVAKVIVLPFNKWILASYLFINRIDLVQISNLRKYARAALLARVPVIIERTDGLRNGAALMSKDGLDAVIASTKGVAKHIEKMIAAEKIHVIYNGFDMKSYDGVEAERFGFSNSDVIIGRTSRLAGGKNISLLIEAVIELRKDPNYDHVRLVICGGNTTQNEAIPMMDQLKKESLPLGESVIFTGEVFDTRAITLGYDIATCTSNSNNEGIPNSLIEAMAAGKAVVSTHVDDIPELVKDKHSGFLIPEQNLAKLVSALAKLINGPQLRQKMGAAAKAKIEAEFNLDRQIEEYRDYYWQLISNVKRHSQVNLTL